MKDFLDPTLQAFDHSIRLQVLREVLEAFPETIGGGEKTKSIPDNVVLSGGVETIKLIIVELVKDYEKLHADNKELSDIAEQATLVGKQQADEWDRFWEAMGVKSEDITVDQAIQKWMAMEVQIAKLREACDLAYGHITNCGDTEAQSAQRGARALSAIRKVLKLDGEQ